MVTVNYISGCFGTDVSSRTAPPVDISEFGWGCSVDPEYSC